MAGFKNDQITNPADYMKGTGSNYEHVGWPKTVISHSGDDPASPRPGTMNDSGGYNSK
jgi:hypothetical protein